MESHRIVKYTAYIAIFAALFIACETVVEENPAITVPSATAIPSPTNIPTVTPPVTSVPSPTNVPFKTDTPTSAKTATPENVRNFEQECQQLIGT